jgi:toluene monooxygenase system ferredoxin subunit
MSLTDFLITLPLQPLPGQHWLIVGPEAEALRQKFSLNIEAVSGWPVPLHPPDGLILAGALSTSTDAAPWLQQMLLTLPEGANLLVIDWQADGPLDTGPALEQRFKRGQLLRQLREAGFGRVDLLRNHPYYYTVSATKQAAPPLAHAGEFVVVATLAELPKNEMKVVDLLGQPVIIANTGREIVAFARACPHAGSFLDSGWLRGRQVICPTHFYMWNVCTGLPLQPEDEDMLPRYPVKVDEQGQVWVALA